MSAVMLEWRSLPYDRSKYLVSGTEIAAAYVPGTLSRFVIIETRGYPRVENGRHVAGDVYFAVRDASTVSDDDARAGKRAKIVNRFAEPDAAVEWCLAQD